MRLLIIGDKDPVRLRMVEVVSEIPGIEVSACGPSEDAVLKRIPEESIDIVVVDIQAAGGALDLVRSVKRGAHPPVVIALSTFSSLQYRAACHRAGAEFFFNKVHEQSRLCEAITDVQKELAGRTISQTEFRQHKESGI
jgi:DNA-binding NarL/FixJ family response regulator